MSYDPTSCPSSSGEIDGNGGINFVIVVCGGSHLGDCVLGGTTDNDAADISSNNWVVSGFKMSAPGQGRAAFADGCNVASNVPRHHIAFINNVITNSGYGWLAGHCAGTNVYDYVAFVGNIVQNSNNWIGYDCGSAVDLNGPNNLDATAGTHIYIAGNFGINNNAAQDTSNCPADHEFIMLDVMSNFPYTGQVVVNNNLWWKTAGHGFHINNFAGSSTSSMNIYVHNNTSFDSCATVPTSGMDNCSEFDMAFNSAKWAVSAQNNIARTNAASGLGGTPIFGVNFADVTSTQSPQPVFSSNVAYGLSNTCQGTCYPSSSNVYLVSCSTAPYYAPGTNTYSDPAFRNTSDLLTNWVGAPNCSSYTNTVACMGWNYNSQSATTNTPIYDLQPTLGGASGDGYQPPGACAADALYPTWLKGVNYLVPPGSGVITTLTEAQGLMNRPCTL